jgi:hypothetical protein
MFKFYRQVLSSIYRGLESKVEIFLGNKKSNINYWKWIWTQWKNNIKRVISHLDIYTLYEQTFLNTPITQTFANMQTEMDSTRNDMI